MKKEYDFSKGERGKFFKVNAETYLPVFIEPGIMAILQRISKANGIEITAIVNDYLRKEISEAEKTPGELGL